MQPLPGIGDMVWHLAHIRALAAHFGGAVTLLAKRRSLADQLFAGEDILRGIIWLDRNPRGRSGEHDGPVGIWRLVRRLREGRFDRVVLLHHSHTLGLAALAAGIRVRQGYGFGAQRWLLNQPPILPAAARKLHQLQRASAFLQAAGVALPDPEPRLMVAPAAREAVLARIAGLQRPLVAIGIGSSEPHRQWGTARMAALAQALLDAGWGSLLLVGGAEDRMLATDIRDRLAHAVGRTTLALGWHLAETAAGLAEVAFYVGNNTGVMNMAAAVGTRTYALFGTTPPFRHSSQILPISAPPGPDDGMARVEVSEVLAAIAADRGGLAPARPA